MKKLLCLFLLLSSCARAPLTDPTKAFRLSEPPANLTDSFAIETLRDALDRNLAAMAKGQNIPEQYVFGDRTISRADYQKALGALKPELESFDRFTAFVKENFEFYDVYGNEAGYGRVFSTGYYDPVMKGSRKKTARHSQAVYRMPADLVSIDLSAYAEKFPELEAVQQIKREQMNRRPIWRGRYVPESKTVIPYYSRAEMEAALSGKGLEILWLDPVDAFFLEIQGSGLVDLGDKKVRVGYAAQNGYPYKPVGRFLTHVIPLEQMSMQRIRQYLATLTPADRDAVLHQNPSYVFFRELSGLSLTYSGAEVTPARTIATDQFLYPKGTLNFLEIELPTFADDTAIDPSGWEAKPRWVFDQDTGGAIRGGGRIDLYMGQGAEGERLGGVMKREGRLWTLAPKQSFLERLAAH